MRTERSRIPRFSIPRRFIYLCLALSAFFFFTTHSPQAAGTSPAVQVSSDAVFTAYRTANSDIIKARSGRFHIDSERTVRVESSLGTVTVEDGEAIITVTPESLDIRSVEETVVLQTGSGTELVEEGETAHRQATPQEDPVLTSLGMCE